MGCNVILFLYLRKGGIGFVREYIVVDGRRRARFWVRFFLLSYFVFKERRRSFIFFVYFKFRWGEK